MSHKAWNKLMHALHGNGPPSAQKTATAAQLAGTSTAASRKARVVALLEASGQSNAQEIYNGLVKADTKASKRMIEVADEAAGDCMAWHKELQEQPAGSGEKGNAK